MKEIKKQIKFKSLRTIILIAFFLFLTPLVQGSPYEESAYAFSKSGEHYFLVQNNSSLFGNNITIVHNCETVIIDLNNSFYAQSNSTKLKISIQPGMYNISIHCDNATFQYSNVYFYPDQLQWVQQFEQLNSFQLPTLDMIILEEAESLANWGSFWSILIVWLLATYVYWNLINHYVQRNFIEEVIE
jgi:hypothetical protein